MQLSDGFIKRIEPGPAPKMISDGTSGLQLVVNPRGSKTFYWRAGGRKIRLSGYKF